MKRLWNPGYTGSPWMPNTLYNDINIYGHPAPPPASAARITDAFELRITDDFDIRITD